MQALIVGCGYVGTALGAELSRQGHSVWGVQRSGATAADLNQAGIIPVIADITKAETLTKLPRQIDWLVNCVSVGKGGAEQYRRVYVEGMRNLLNWLEPGWKGRLVYTSSTGVYGQNDGSIVTESSATEPDSDTGRELLAAEELLLSGVKGRRFSAAVLRLAGIYGPERGYWLRQFLAGHVSLEGAGQRVLNMVHRDDVVGAILAVLMADKPGTIYNVVDNEPVTQFEMFEWLATRLRRHLPLETSAPTLAMRKRVATNKRVSNERLRRELNYAFRYPTFREGYEVELNRLQKS